VYIADEAGLRSDYHGGTTWAPVGRTPIVRTTGARHSINTISAVTGKGAMLWVPETLHASCDLLILVDQPPEPVASPNVVDLGPHVAGEGS
jgi:hypothetical protein